MPTVASVELRHYRPGDEVEIVAVLRACHADGWGDQATWAWKHTKRPGFKPADIVVARVEGQAVGCFHFAILPLRLEDGLEVPVSIDGDFAVLPPHRKQQIPLRVIDETDPEQRRRGALLRGGFTSEELSERFYNRRFGQVFVPAVTTQYRKILGPDPLVPRVEALGRALLAKRRVRAALERRPLTIDLRIEGFPACGLELTADGFRLERGTPPKPHLRVRMPYRLVARLADGGGPFVRAAARLVLRRQVRVRGVVRQLPRLIAIAWFYLIGR